MTREDPAALRAAQLIRHIDGPHHAAACEWAGYGENACPDRLAALSAAPPPPDLSEPAIQRPVYLFWSEDKERNPVELGWGGSDLYRCDECEGWQGDGIEAGERHSLLHVRAARALLSDTEASPR